MNETVFHRVELWALDFVITQLSQSRARLLLGEVLQFAASKPIFVSGVLICASCFVGLMSGYLFHILTLSPR